VKFRWDRVRALVPAISQREKVMRKDTCEFHNGPSHEAEKVSEMERHRMVAVRCDECGRVRGIRMVRK
jgi:hypothetical protein